MKKNSFCLKEAKGDDYHYIMIVDSSLKNFKNKSLFSWLLLITIDLKDKTEPYKLPTNQEAKVLDWVEDHFTKLIGSTTTYQYVGKITGDGIRKLYYYVEDPEKIHQKLTDIIQNGDYVRDFEYSITKDIEWNEVNFFFNG
jgi:hypothetical protein